MAYVVQQIVKTTAGWAEFDALGKPMPKDYWLFEQVAETSEDVTRQYYKFKISDGVNLFADLPYQLLNGHSASINEAGNWLVYDDATQTYKDSGTRAIGMDGKSAFELWQALEGNADKTIEDFFVYLKGEKGDAFTFDDFTTEQLALLKGAPFTYADFTEEQLAGLKGQDGQSAYLDAQAKGYTGTKDEFDTRLANIGFSDVPSLEFLWLNSLSQGYEPTSYDIYQELEPLGGFDKLWEDFDKHKLWVYLKYQNTGNPLYADFYTRYGIAEVGKRTDQESGWRMLFIHTEYSMLPFGRRDCQMVVTDKGADKGIMDRFTLRGSKCGYFPVLANDENTTTIYTQTNGAGEKFLSDDGTYRSPIEGVFNPTYIVTLTSLASLSPTKYSQKFTYTTTTAQEISFNGTPAEGFECMLDILNSTSSPITQALPNAENWQCDETSLVIPAGKVGSISIRYVHGIYCVRVGL